MGWSKLGEDGRLSKGCKYVKYLKYISQRQVLIWFFKKQMRHHRSNNADGQVKKDLIQCSVSGRHVLEFQGGERDCHKGIVFGEAQVTCKKVCTSPICTASCTQKAGFLRLGNGLICCLRYQIF